MARTNTWVNVGTETKATNIQDVLRESGLDYNVVTRPLTTTFNDKEILVPGRVATVNEKTGEIIGVVSNKYQICQNEETLPLNDNLPFSYCRHLH